MQEIARGMLSLPLQLTQFGAQQLTSRFGGRPSGRTPADPLPCQPRPVMIGRSIGRQQLGRALLKWTAGALDWTALPTIANGRSLIDLVGLSPALLELVVPGRTSRIVWKEATNKLRAYFLFTNADLEVGLTADDLDLVSAAEQVGSLPAYDGLWCTEGLGYYHAAALADRQELPRSLLANNATEHLPARFLLPLHTGMGLALALRQLATLSSTASAPTVRQRVDAFLELCEANSRPGYAPAAAEALGLIARLLTPRLIPILDREMAAIDENHVGRFWHGVGRALYFSPTSILPCGSLVWPGIRQARSEPTHELGRINAVAGLAWAVTLINIRDPDVVEAFLARHEDQWDDALANGVSSAVTVWHDWLPDSNLSDQLSQYQPRHLNPDVRAFWERTVGTQPGGESRRHYHQLKRTNRLGELFQYAAQGN